MQRGMVFVRAQSPSGKWHSADVMDLDDESFRIFVLEMLRRKSIIHVTVDDDEEEFVYKSTKEPE